MVDTKTPWNAPLLYAAAVAQQPGEMVFLYRGMQTDYSGDISILAWGAHTDYINATPEVIREALQESSQGGWQRALFGYLGYEYTTADMEQSDHADSGHIQTPYSILLQCSNVILFHHSTFTVELVAGEMPDISAAMLPALPSLHVLAVHSNMRKAEYISRVKNIIEHIHAGDCSQANLTRKFYGEFMQEVRGFPLFLQLAEQNPAPFSAYMRYGNVEIISASPECFMHATPEGKLSTYPIKGTVRDEADIATQLLSEKNKAENLMITDLMRNDLAQSCRAGSIKVNQLYGVYSFPHLHHLISAVSGEKKQEISVVDALVTALPPGSMTGSPKHKAMELCAKYEHQPRGIYSGVMGYFYPNGAAMFSVIIRTLVLQQGRRFEFQVGGGIVADSTPEQEWEESLTKARGICKLLSLPLSMLERI